MQLTKIDNYKIKALEKVPESLRHWVEPKLEKPFRELDNNTALLHCLEIITVAHNDFNNGGGADSKILQAQANLLFIELCQNRPFKLSKSKFLIFTPSEVKNAFRLGIRGEFGQFFGLNPKTYYQFLKGYMNSEERKQANSEYFKVLQELEKPQEPTKDEKDMIAKKGLIKLFNDYKNKEINPMYIDGDYLPDASFCGRYYVSLCELKGVKSLVSKERLEDIKQKGLLSYQTHLKKKQQFYSNNGLRNEAKRIGDLLNSGIDNETLKCHCRRIALKEYFDECITNNKEII